MDALLFLRSCSSSARISRVKKSERAASSSGLLLSPCTCSAQLLPLFGSRTLLNASSEYLLPARLANLRSLFLANLRIFSESKICKRKRNQNHSTKRKWMIDCMPSTSGDMGDIRRPSLSGLPWTVNSHIHLGSDGRLLMSFSRAGSDGRLLMSFSRASSKDPTCNIFTCFWVLVGCAIHRVKIQSAFMWRQVKTTGILC